MGTDAVNADATQAPLSLTAWLLLLGVVLAVCVVVRLVERRQERRDQRGEYVPPRMPRGRL